MILNAGAGHIPVHDLKDYTASQRLSEIEALESGVIFCTYTLLLKRLEQLTDWCGPDFDGVLAFDECHKAKSVKVNGEKTTGMFCHPQSTFCVPTVYRQLWV